MWPWSMRSCLASWVSFEIAGGALRPFRDARPLPQRPHRVQAMCSTCGSGLVSRWAAKQPQISTGNPPSQSIILYRRLRRVLAQPRQWLVLGRPRHWHRRQQGRPRLAVVGLGRCTRGYLRVWRGRGRTRCTRHRRSETGWRAGSLGHGQTSHQQRGQDRVKHQQPPVGNLLTGYA
jgi:hypothetical protein